MIDTLTGENRLLAVDILHDVGASLNPAIDRDDRGRLPQGTGWLTSEELMRNDAGSRRRTRPPRQDSGCRDWPERFSVEFYGEANHEPTVHRSKAVGEPPLMLALSVFHAPGHAWPLPAAGESPARCAGNRRGDPERHRGAVRRCRRLAGRSQAARARGAAHMSARP
jgi:xanthine dehydrogenase large subunit